MWERHTKSLPQYFIGIKTPLSKSILKPHSNMYVYNKYINKKTKKNN